MCYTDASRAVFGSGTQQQPQAATPPAAQVGKRGSPAEPTASRPRDGSTGGSSPFRSDLSIPTASPSGGAGINIPH